MQKILSKIKEINIPRLLFMISVSIFIFLCVTALLKHMPWFDELNAWDIAANVSFFDLFKVTRHEGHMFIWYTILMPFAKNNLFYPYSMQLINLLFMILAILLMWKYAPFNPVAKALITLSFPMRWHAVYARCYSIGILFLFAIAALYPKRMKHPLWYAFLIILAANTSVMALIGSFAFGVLFLYDLFKNSRSISKGTLIKTLLIFTAGAGIILFSFWNLVKPCYAESIDTSAVCRCFFSFFIGADYSVKHILFSISYLLLLLLSPIFFRKDLKSLCFLYVTTSMLLLVFFKIYRPNFWHITFLFLYFIIAMWIYLSSVPDFDLKIGRKLYMCVWYLFLFFMVIYFKHVPEIEYSHLDLQKYIEENIQLFKDKKIFFFKSFSHSRAILPYIEKYSLDFYGAKGDKHGSLDFYLNQYKRPDPASDFKNIYDTMGEDKTAYMIIDLEDFINTETQNIIKNYKKHGLKLIPYKAISPAFIYRIEK